MQWVNPKFDGFSFKLEGARVLGKGSFAQIQVGKCRKLDIDVVVKNGNEGVLNQDSSEESIEEMMLLKQLDHPNVIRMIGYQVCRLNKVYATYLEFHEKGDLWNHIIALPDPMDENTYFKLFEQLLDAVEYVHSKGYAHLDIKPENILIGRNDEAILTDFNLSDKHNVNGRSTRFKVQRGTALYMAPEMAHRGSCDLGVKGRPLDIWACGLVLYNMMTKKAPWNFAEPGSDPLYDEWESENGNYHCNVTSRTTLHVDDGWNLMSGRAFDFMHSILAVSPSNRFKDVKSVRKHHWFKFTQVKHNYVGPAGDAPHVPFVRRRMNVSMFKCLSAA